MDTKIQVLVFMSEIKFDLTLKKFKISVSFMLLFAIIKLSTYSSTLSSENLTFFFFAISRQFSLGGIVLVFFFFFFFFFFCHFTSIQSRGYSIG